VIKINLAPPIAKTRVVGAGVNLGLVFGGLFGLLVVGLATWGWILAAQVARVQAEVADNEREISRLKPIIAEGERYRDEKEELERRVNAIEVVARNQARPVYLLDSLVDLLPADLWLTRVEEKNQRLRLAGTTYTSVTLSDFMANLKASGKFKDVDLVESKQDLTKSPRMITFEVTCQFEI
jgi:type IV pilus assembly protein PilN